MAKTGTLWTPNAGEEVVQQELSIIARGNESGIATLENILVVS